MWENVKCGLYRWDNGLLNSLININAKILLVNFDKWFSIITILK
jgi:hypothetical protein